MPTDDSQEFNPYGGAVFGEPATPAPEPEPAAPANPYGAPLAQPPAPGYQPELEDSRFGAPLAPPPQAGGAAPELALDASGRIAEAFGAVFALILQLRATADYGDADTLRERTLGLFQEAATAALDRGAERADVDAATFALVAFFDEAVLLSEWSGREGWMARPLQLQLYDRYDAGEQFFVRLRELLAADGRAGAGDRTEALEVYYLAMALGFKGQYQIHGQDELRRLVGQAQERLATVPDLRPGALAPHGTPKRTVAVEVGRSVSPWMLLAAAVLLGLVVYAGLSVWTSAAAGDVAEALRSLAAGG